MSEYPENERREYERSAHVSAQSLADYAPPADGELHLPEWQEDEVLEVSPTPVPPVQAAFNGWDTQLDAVDSGLRAERDDNTQRYSRDRDDTAASFELSHTLSRTGNRIQQQGREWGNATIAIFAARKQQQSLLWLGLLCLALLVALVLLFRPRIESPAPALPQTVALDVTEPIAQADSAPVAIVDTNVSPVVESPPAVVAPPAVVPAPRPVASAPSASQPRTAQPSQPATVTKAPVKPAAASSATVAKGGFTVQVAAAHNEANIKALAQKLPKQAQVQIVRSWRDGKPWYVLTYGHYKSREEAAKVRDQLPPEVRKGNAAWVREL